jgi:sarcosine oxidase subunit beta
LVRSKNPDVTIVGGGIIGLFCAFFLASRGLKVVVLERKTPGSGSSTRNGGGVRSQWGTATNIQLSVLSQLYWAEFQERFGVDVGLRRIGYLFLAADTDGLDELRRQVALQHQFGVASEILTATDIATRWPSLGDLDVAGASFCDSDGFLNQHRVVHAMTRAVEAAGVAIECGIEVTGLDVKAGRITAVRTSAGRIGTDLVVNCAGAWAPGVAEQLGVSLPIRSRRVQLMLAHTATPLPADLPWLIDPVGQVHIRQDLDGRALVGGFLGTDETVDPWDFNHDADPDWRSAVVQVIAERFGIAIDRSTTIDSWAGLYPTTPDQHPIIDRTDAGMVVVGGFAGAGLMHSPAAGLLTAELIVDGRISSTDPAPLSLARFSKPMESVERTGI